MSVSSGNAKGGWPKRWRLFSVLILISLISGYVGWQFVFRYQIESKVLEGYENENRELWVVLTKQLEHEPQHWGVAEQISRTLADRLRQQGYSVRLVKSETVKGRSSREKAEMATDSAAEAYESRITPLSSQALAEAAQAQAGVLHVYLSKVAFMRRSQTVASETYVLELWNPDRRPAWQATLTYRSSAVEPLFYLLRYSLDDPAASRAEALADEAIARMQQQGVLK